ncbi:MAG: hypothetical protein IPL39_20465 [Opitutaceae bacterium]|nr:hypothetical protein [Opitutaceae bacterium]
MNIQNQTIVAQMRRLCDGCEFRSIKNIIQHRRHKVDRVLFVNRRFDLAEVAAAFSGGFPKKTTRSYFGIVS